MHCAICQADLIVDRTPLDDLGTLDDDTPELVCTRCGSAVISAPLTGRVWWRPRGAKIAPHQRRAA
jgi:DNA-directed RNA polymerase subunit RPC12/RpoP